MTQKDKRNKPLNDIDRDGVRCYIKYQIIPIKILGIDYRTTGDTWNGNIDVSFFMHFSGNGWSPIQLEAGRRTKYREG